MAIFQDLKMGSEARLWELIAARSETGADLEAIDARIWQLFGEEWAVVFTDLSGFSRRSQQFGITHFLQIIFESKQLLYPVIADHGGFLVKSEGDSMLLLFRSPAAALRGVMAMQRACRIEDARRVAEEQILLCAGIGWGRVLRVGEHEVWGEEVNLASKLGEDTAGTYQILVTEAVRDQVASDAEFRFEALEQRLFGDNRAYELSYSY